MESQFGTALLDDLKGPDSDSHCGLSKLRGWVSVDPRFRRRTKRYTTTDTRIREEKFHTPNANAFGAQEVNSVFVVKKLLSLVSNVFVHVRRFFVPSLRRSFVVSLSSEM